MVVLVVLFPDFLKKYQCGKYNYQCNHLVVEVVAPLFSRRLYHIFLHVSISILHRNRTHRTSSSTYYVLVRILKRVGSFSTKYFSMCVCVGLFVSSRRSSPGESPTHRRSYYYRQPPGSSPGTRCRAGRANPGIYSLMGERVAMYVQHSRVRELWVFTIRHCMIMGTPLRVSPPGVYQQTHKTAKLAG